MKFFKTIRGQLTFYFVLIFGVMLCVFSIVLYNVFAEQSRAELDKGILMLAGVINDEMQDDSIQPEILNEVNEASIPFSSPKRQFVEVIDESGNIILKSPELGNEILPIESEWIEKSLNGNPVIKTSQGKIENVLKDPYGMRVLLYPVNFKSKKYIITVAVSLSNLESVLFKFRLILYIAIPLTLIVSSILGWIFSKKAYAPINELIKNSNSITANNLDIRLPVSDSGDEISQLAKTLNSMMERLQRSFLVLKQFTSDASHEMRTPLTILKGEIEVALNKDRSISEYEKILKDNLDEVERLQKIIDGLLALSQLESGKIQLRNDKIDLNELLTEAVSKIDKLAKKKNINMVLKLDESMGDEMKTYYILGEHSMLLNVFINLLDNAVKYSNADSEIICSGALNVAEEKISVSIKDTGRGIPPENLENIFDRFYRGDPSRTRDESNSIGLGLAIAKSVIEVHKGTIMVNSIQGKGTTFTITFQLHSQTIT
ncbi:MAG: ATP-binding protein [Bacteroidota bacterium]|nr:ATP-binding protein [Bacteroidota bacterium]